MATNARLQQGSRLHQESSTLHQATDATAGASSVSEGLRNLKVVSLEFLLQQPCCGLRHLRRSPVPYYSSCQCPFKN